MGKDKTVEINFEAVEPTEPDVALSRDEFHKKYGELTKEQLLECFFLRDKTSRLFQRRLEGACDVIDLVAKELGLSDKGLYLYSDHAGKTPLVDKIKEYVARGGDKALMKKRLDELENENAMLRSLIVVKPAE